MSVNFLVAAAIGIGGTCWIGSVAAQGRLSASEANAYVREAGADKVANLVVAELQKNLPIRMNSLEQTTGVFYLQTNKTITFRHLLAKDWEDQLSSLANVARGEVAETLRTTSHTFMVRFSCQDPLQRALLDAGVSLEHVYYNFAAAVEFSTRVQARDCVQAGIGGPASVPRPNNSSKPTPLRGAA